MDFFVGFFFGVDICILFGWPIFFPQPPGQRSTSGGAKRIQTVVEILVQNGDFKTP